MESVLSFIGLSFGRDQELAPPSEAEAYSTEKAFTRMMLDDLHGPSEAF